MDNENLFSLDEFLSVNQPKKLSEVDYLHAIFKLAGLPIDLLLCFIKLLMPEFKVFDGLVFLNTSFDLNAYKIYLLEGKSIGEIQLWINLVEITGVFEDIEEDDAVQLANAIVDIWNLQLDKDIIGLGKARVIHSKEEGEVFVTIDQSCLEGV